MKDRASERIEFLNLNSSRELTLFDLSRTGICCFHNRKKEKNSLLTIRINDLSVKARTIYCQQRTDGFRIGMQFIGVTSEQHKRLNELVETFSRGVPVFCTIEE
jgi:hypothetical protein